MSEILYELVKDLSGVEKALLVKNASSYTRKKKPRYLELLRLYDGMKRYDPEEAKRKGRKILPASQLAYQKHYLTQTILQLLGEQSDHPTNTSFRELGVIRLLISRGHIKLATKRTHALKASLIRSEQFSQHLQLLDVEMVLARLKPDVDWMSRIYAEMRELMNVFQNYLEYRELQERFDRLVLSGEVREKQIIEMDKILAHPLMQGPEAAMSRGARFLYYRVLGGRSYLGRDWDLTEHRIRLSLEALGNDRILLQTYHEMYIKQMLNMAFLLGMKNDWTGMMQAFEDLDTTLPKIRDLSPQMAKWVDLRRYIYPLDYLVRNEEYADAVKFIRVSRGSIDLESDALIDIQTEALLMSSFACLADNKPIFAQECLDFIELFQFRADRHDLRLMGSLLQMLISIELNQVDQWPLMSNDFNSTYAEDVPLFAKTMFKAFTALSEDKIMRTEFYRAIGPVFVPEMYGDNEHQMLSIAPIDRFVLDKIKNT